MATRTLVGLDIGSKFIKAVQLSEERENEYAVTGFGATTICWPAWRSGATI